MYSQKMKLHVLVPNSYIHVPIYEQFIYSQDQSAYLAASKWADGTWEYINCSQIHECENWGTFIINSVLEIKRPCSFIYGNK
jgi:hypothetical protein